MSMYDDAFDWDDEITSDGDEYVTLMPGMYSATVKDIEKCVDTGNGKMAGMKYGEITIQIEGEKKATIKDRMYLSRKFEWKIGQFLVACRLKKADEPVRAAQIMKAKGARIRVNITAEAGKDDYYKRLTEDEVKEFLDAGKSVYNKIGKYFKAESASSEPVEDDEFGFGD